MHFADSTLLPGHYGVFGFFMLSGYLMTLIMNSNYGYKSRGIAIYGVNRLLRIYPMYWLACLISIGVLLLLDSWRSGVNSVYFMPETPQQWLKNLALTVRVSTSPLLIAPAWTLTVELFYYVFIGLGVSRNRKITAVWLLVSIAYTIYMLVIGSSFGSRFFTLGAASLPLAVGACLYHWRDVASNKLSLLASHAAGPVIALSLFLINGITANYLGGYEGYFSM